MDFKVIYHNFRVGQVAIYSILTLVNFVVITYSLTIVGKMIPLLIYIPIVLSIVMIAAVFVGKYFKKIQLKTDNNEVFRYQTDLIKTLRLILETDNEDERKAWIEELKKHEQN